MWDYWMRGGGLPFGTIAKVPSKAFYFRPTRYRRLGSELVRGAFASAYVEAGATVLRGAIIVTVYQCEDERTPQRCSDDNQPPFSDHSRSSPNDVSKDIHMVAYQQIKQKPAFLSR